MACSTSRVMTTGTPSRRSSCTGASGRSSCRTAAGCPRGSGRACWNETRHAERSRVAPRLGPPTDGTGLAELVWNETRHAERSRVAPRLGPPTDGTGLAELVWNETRHAERSRVAPRLGPPTDGTGLADPATMTRAGFVSLIGRPNTGKSTLLNRLVGQKLAIVSPRPQTTRNRITGIKNLPGAQIVFVDTPGLHTSAGRLGAFMQQTARRAVEEVDLVCLVVDAAQRIHPDRLVLEPLEAYRGPVFCVLNKADLVRPKGRMLPVLEAWRGTHPFRELVPVSATEGTNCDRLLALIMGILPEHPPFFPEDATSDQPETFWVAEIIREKVFLLTRQEVPYAVAVRVEELVERKDPACLYIRATVFVEQESQKGILIGKGAAMLKRIGTAARRELEAFFGIKAYLGLTVEVRRHWRRDGARQVGGGRHRLVPPRRERPGGDLLFTRLRQDPRRRQGLAPAPVAVRRRPRALHARRAGLLRPGPERAGPDRPLRHRAPVRPGAWRPRAARAGVVDRRVGGAPDGRARPARGALCAADPEPARPGGAGPAVARRALLRRARARDAGSPAAPGRVYGVRSGLPVSPARSRRGRRRLRAVCARGRGDGPCLVCGARGVRATPLGALGRGARHAGRQERERDRRPPGDPGRATHRPADARGQVPPRGATARAYLRRTRLTVSP